MQQQKRGESAAPRERVEEREESARAHTPERAARVWIRGGELRSGAGWAAGGERENERERERESARARARERRRRWVGKRDKRQKVRERVCKQDNLTLITGQVNPDNRTT
jgi:hypothetical protein